MISSLELATLSIKWEARIKTFSGKQGLKNLTSQSIFLTKLEEENPKKRMKRDAGYRGALEEADGILSGKNLDAAYREQ